MKPLRIAVLGGGPIGVEAALYAATLGHDVTLLEKGTVGENLDRWGHVTLFSPWKMNHTPLGRATLEAGGYRRWPSPEASLSGRELRQLYVLPLANSPLLRHRIQENSRVVAIGREGLLKGEQIGSRARLEHPFRLLVQSPRGEVLFQADRVVDATGTYDQPNCLGSGGIPAPGEQGARENISYELDDPLERQRSRYAGKRILLVGAGYSAATSLIACRRLVQEEPGTSLLWVTRGASHPPYEVHSDDPLPGRAALLAEANRIGCADETGFRRLAGREIESIRPLPDQTLEVQLRSKQGIESHHVDRILANVGYQPDRSLYKELQVHECYASSGPMRLAVAVLSRASADCLAQGGHGAEALLNPEPGFFILGSKSYGRISSFLLRTGFEQIRDLFRLIQGQPELDLYAAPSGVRT